MAEWLEPVPVPVPEDLAAEVGGTALVAQTLVRRGILTVPRARGFLDPDLYSPTSAWELPGMEQAVQALITSIRSHQPVLVWGDFDMDGQTATTLLVEVLQQIGAQVDFHIPLRESEGHGVSPSVLQKYLAEKPYLLLTCDTGSSALAAVESAKACGAPIVITDHHDLPEILPPATALVNPKLLQVDHHLASLSGVGVACKLAEALTERLGKTDLVETTLDLVALGLVADMAELRDDARYLVQRGLRLLRNPARLGLLALYERLELNPATLNEEHIGFMLAPPLNALGRLGDAVMGVELLSTGDLPRARVLALQLQGLNERRKFLTDQVWQAVEAMLERQPELLDAPVLVLYHPEWPGGVLGIVASHLVEAYERPAVLLSGPAGGLAHGSARSLDGVHITEAIGACNSLLTSFGGHPMAAGLSLPIENISQFRKQIAEAVLSQTGGSLPQVDLQIDAYLPFSNLSLELVEDLERLAPYGQGNFPLVFACQACSIENKAVIGKDGDHLLLTITDDSKIQQKVIWWDGASQTLPEGSFDLAYTLRASNYRGMRDLQVEWISSRLLTAPGGIELVAAPRIQVVDRRRASHPQAVLDEIRKLPGTLVWAEGQLRELIGGVDRNGLTPVENLVIWTPPPSNTVLQTALRTVQPNTVYLFNSDPGMDSFEAFTQRLAGLVRYAMRTYEGVVDLQKLAAASAHTTEAAARGVSWMESKGYILIREKTETYWLVSPGLMDSVPVHPESSIQVTHLLEETRAYRSYYAWADAEKLVNLEKV